MGKKIIISIYILIFLLPYSSFGEIQKDTISYKKNNIIPFIYYTQETSLAFGVMAPYAYHWKNSLPDNRPNSYILMAYYTMKNQGLIHLIPEFYWNKDSNKFRLDLSAYRWPDKFFGVGNDIPAKAEGENFIYDGFHLKSTYITRIYKDYRVGPHLDFEYAKMVEIEKGGLLDKKIYTGSDGGNVSGIGLILEWDNRDQIFWPKKGGYYQAKNVWYNKIFGSDYTYSQLTLDFRRFIMLTGNHILGIQALAILSNGQAPIHNMGLLGGIQNMRGIYRGKFRDNNLLTIQAEYRFPIKKKFSGVLFGGVGEVANKIEKFKTSGIKTGVGIGLRYAVDPKNKVNIRFDLGITESGAKPIIMIYEAF